MPATLTAVRRPRSLGPRELRREFDKRARTAKAIALGLKETLEDGRLPGIPPQVG